MSQYITPGNGVERIAILNYLHAHQRAIQDMIDEQDAIDEQLWERNNNVIPMSPTSPVEFDIDENWNVRLNDVARRLFE